MWPTASLEGVETCTASPTVLCTPSGSSPGIENSPTVSSCYTGTSLTASTLTNQAQTPCASTSYFCTVGAQLKNVLVKKFLSKKRLV
jgi:hypothetical protein